jgi:hypothetical protein
MKVIIPGAIAGLAAATLVTLAAAANADAGPTEMIRPGGFVHALSDTRATGHVEFLKEGLHVWTESNTSTDKAAEYFAVPPQGLPDNASLTWYGTSPQPGSQLVFDADGDSSTTDDAYNILVGEPTYGDDFWMSTGSDIYTNHHDQCPLTTGGSGSDCHGTLAQWQAAFPNATLSAAGFSLGSGIKGDGVIHDIQVGDTDYQFTSESAVTTVPVTGSAVATVSERSHYQVLNVKMDTDALGENEVVGSRLWFRVSDNGDTLFHTRLGADDTARLHLTFADHTGKHKIVIDKNGEVDQKIVIRTGRHH